MTATKAKACAAAVGILDVARSLRRIGAQGPVLAFAASMRLEVQVPAEEAGRADYCLKQGRFAAAGQALAVAAAAQVLGLAVSSKLLRDFQLRAEPACCDQIHTQRPAQHQTNLSLA